jgi:hypothetical protein
VTRPHRRRLAIDEARRLAKGVLARFQDGDTPASVAERMNLPVHRVQQALDEDRRRVRYGRGRGVTADDLAESLSLPRPFVVYVMKQGHAVRDARPLRQAGGSQQDEEKRRARLYESRAGLSHQEAVREARRLTDRGRKGRE